MRTVLVQVHGRDRYGHLRGVFACIGPTTGPLHALETLDKRKIVSNLQTMLRSADDIRSRAQSGTTF